ncbi:MAG: PQQ-binding-like beta-propeller repeat protein [Vicinamibacterales bacterium]
MWIPGAYDPETRLYIFGTGNPTPGYTGAGRPGDNLFTCSLVAVNVDTGKMAWYFQTSAHDTHDWDSAQTPVLIDGVINGQPRKLVSQATIAGSLVSPTEGGTVNWPPPAFSPDTGLFYVQESNGYNLLYLTDPDPRGSMGLGGKSVAPVGSGGNFLNAIDYRTGKSVWRHAWPGGGGGGLLTSAGRVLFSGDGSGNLVAFDATNRKLLWHTRIGNISNAPQTYMVDGRQHLLVAVNDTLYAFKIY